MSKNMDVQDERADAPRCWCGGRDYREKLSGSWNRAGHAPITFSAVACRRCGLVRTLPVPDESRYSAGESHWSSSRPLEDGYSAGIAADLLDRIGGNRLLDIGCNVGNVVAAAAELGADAQGIDLDPVAIEIGRGAGRNIYLRDIEDEDGEWDAIVLNHVLEHVTDLRAFLTHVARLAAPGAVIGINVPCYRGLVPRLMGDHWFAWSPPEHVWQFDRRTLRHVVETSTPLRATHVAHHGMIEPPSSGLKGRAKRAIGRFGDSIGMGDQVEAVFHNPSRSYFGAGRRAAESVAEAPAQPPLGQRPGVS